MHLLRRALLALALLGALAPAVASADVVPTQIQTIVIGQMGVPTSSPFDLDGHDWEVVGTFEVPAEFGRVFFVQSDQWLGAAYRALDICMVTPSGICLDTDQPNPEIGAPCVSLRVYCESFAIGSDIGDNEPGEWSIRFSGLTNARHIIRVFAW